MFNAIMHVSFYTDHWDEMMDFYTKKLELPVKYVVKYKEYINRPDRKVLYERALKTPEAIFNAYIEVAPGQFIEMFHANENQKDHPGFNENKGYSHFAVMVDDIHQTYNEYLSKGINVISGPSKGPSGTWQFWIADPDDNRIEVMQFTEDSYQIKGNPNNK